MLWNKVIGAGGAGPTGPIKYTDFQQSADGARSSYTFTSVNLGEATSNKYVVVMCLWVSGFSERTLSSITIDGVSATTGTLTSGSLAVGIGYGFAPVNSTTGNIVCNWSGDTAALYGEYIEVWEWAEDTGFTLSFHDDASSENQTSPVIDTFAGDGVFLLNTNNWASYDNAAVVTDRASGGFAAGHVSPLDTVTAQPSGLADFTSTGSDTSARHAAVSLTPS